MVKIKAESCFMKSFLKDLWASFKSITKIFKEKDINFCIIGGSILSIYNYNRTTEDIDLLVDAKDRNKIKDLPIGYIRDIGFSKNGKRLKLHSPETPIDIIYTYENDVEFMNQPIKKISKIINGVPILKLENLIEFKLYANRRRDLSDVFELIIRNNLPKTFMDFTKNCVIINRYTVLWEEKE
jgi:predicted nucleotidyltransferase